MQSDVVTGMELVADNAVENFRQLLGPTDSAEAKRVDPNSLRAYFGSDKMRNGIHGSADAACYQKEASLFFST